MEKRVCKTKVGTLGGYLLGRMRDLQSLELAWVVDGWEYPVGEWI